MSSVASNQLLLKRVVENATLLWTLTNIPEQPRVFKSYASKDRTRRLTVERERHLADDLAFLAAYKDDMITAAGVEEDLDGKGITVRIASNTGGFSSVKEYFTKIARLLERATLRAESRIDLRREILEQIITLDYSRIMSRLRSRRAAKSRKTTGKPCLISLLSKTVNDSSIIPLGKVTDVEIVELRFLTERLAKIFNNFEVIKDNSASKTLLHAELVNIILQAHDLCGKTDLEAALRTSHAIDPTLKKFLPEAIGKLSRYYSISCDLIDAARNLKYNSIFSRVLIEFVPHPEFNTTFITDHPASFDETLENVNKSLLVKNPAVDAMIVAARNKFKTRMYDSRTTWKVHAEIQLLYFYESNLTIRHPRVLCASKSACYLCCLFINIHGEFQVPRTHGRIYDKWMLPVLPTDIAPGRQHSLAHVTRQLDSEVKAQILHTLQDTKRVYEHPNESVLPFRENWSSSSTLARSIQQQRIGPPFTNAEREGSHLGATSPGIDPLSSVLRVDLGPSRRLPEISNAELVKKSDFYNIPYVSPVKFHAPAKYLDQNSWISRRLTATDHTFCVHTNTVNLDISWDLAPLEDTIDPSPGKNICWIQVKRINSSQAQPNDTSLEFINLKEVKEDTTITTEAGAALSSRSLCLEQGKDLLIIKYSFEDPCMQFT